MAAKSGVAARSFLFWAAVAVLVADDNAPPRDGSEGVVAPQGVPETELRFAAAAVV